jgi:DNA-binding response OmpR family regulator
MDPDRVFGSSVRGRRVAAGRVWEKKVYQAVDNSRRKESVGMTHKILIVDDTLATLGALAELLSNAGFQVVTASDFEEAKRKIDSESPDLLVVDIRLGPYNGLHLVVRERLAHPEVPIIMTTGFPDALLEAEARRYGAEFLEKPIRSADLIALVKKLLAGREMQSAD